MNKIICLILVGFILPVLAVAQPDSIANRFRKEFNSFHQSIQQKHQEFRVKNDSVFSKFLKDSWASFDVLYKSKPVEVKPMVQPTVEPQQEKKEQPDLEIPTDSAVDREIRKKDQLSGTPVKNDIPSEYDNAGIAMLNLDFYGNELKLSYPSRIPPVNNLSEEGISNYFSQAGNSPSILKLVADLIQEKAKLKLNDWGYFKLVENTVTRIEQERNRQALLSWVLLLKSGYNAKIGFTKNTVFLLLPFYEELFNNYFVDVNGKEYYFITEGLTNDNLNQLTVHKADYPGNNFLSLKIHLLPDLGMGYVHKEFTFKGTKFTVKQNSSLINFYKDYPVCTMEVHFSSPLSNDVLESLENYFNPLFAGLSDEEKVSFLLEFTQKAFSYQSDKEQFKREKYFFPDELFFYPYSDCEDRAVLFTRLVRHFTRLKCIALDYPGHVNAAVSLKGSIHGTFITFNGTKYFVCDPTYINAPIGYLPDEYKGIKPKVITFE